VSADVTAPTAASRSNPVLVALTKAHSGNSHRRPHGSPHLRRTSRRHRSRTRSLQKERHRAGFLRRRRALVRALAPVLVGSVRAVADLGQQAELNSARADSVHSVVAATQVADPAVALGADLVAAGRALPVAVAPQANSARASRPVPGCQESRDLAGTVARRRTLLRVLRVPPV
jgi:hypothetical protein